MTLDRLSVEYVLPLVLGSAAPFVAPRGEAFPVRPVHAQGVGVRGTRSAHRLFVERADGSGAARSCRRVNCCGSSDCGRWWHSAQSSECRPDAIVFEPNHREINN
jgi:hypothetical protein